MTKRLTARSWHRSRRALTSTTPVPGAAPRRHRAAGLREAGMTTAEYAVGTIAAVAFAALLLVVVRSDAVRAALESIITSALSRPA